MRNFTLNRRRLQFIAGLAVSALIGGMVWPALAQRTHVKGAIAVGIVENGIAEKNGDIVEAAPVEEEPATDSNTETVALTFACDDSEGIATTVVQTSAGEVPIVRWDAAVIALETTPQADCTASTERFQVAYDEGLLSYLTTGRMNGQLVVCGTTELNGVCRSRLLDLRPTPKPRIALQQVLQIRLPASGPLSDTDCRAYVDLGRYLAGGYDDLSDGICPPKATPLKNISPQTPSATLPVDILSSRPNRAILVNSYA